MDWPQSPTLVILVLVTLLVVCLVFLRLPFTEFIELKLYDSRFRYRGPQPASQELAIVALDDESVQKIGRWPWPREVFPQFLHRLKKAQPRVIGLDIIFAEKEDSAALLCLERLRGKMQQRSLARPEIMSLLQEEEQKVDVDRLLAEEIGRDTPIILGFFFKEVGAQIVSPEADELLGPTVVQVSTFNLVRHLDEKEERLPIIGAKGVEVNLPAISSAAAGGGYFNIIPDADGTVRWLFHPQDGRPAAGA